MTGIILYLVISLAVGILSCFWGKKFYYPIIAVYSFLFAFMVCNSLIGAGPVGIIISVVIGLIVALLSKFFYKLGVFIVSALCGLVIGGIIAAFIPSALFVLQWIVIIGVAIAVGILAVKFCDLFIMLSTSFAGASLIASTVTFLVFNFSKIKSFAGIDIEAAAANVENYIKGTHTMAQNITLLSVTVILTVIGMIYQHKTNKN